MATFDAVGAVGLTLQALLRDRVQHPSGIPDPVQVTLGPPGPDRDPAGAVESARVNLFLYRVAENPYLRNQEIPGHGHPGAYGHPPLSVDLHYLLTVFGSTVSGDYFDEIPAHRLLGSVMQVLAEHPILTDTIVTRRAPAGVPVLDPALRAEFERIKITLLPMGVEELTNVWTSLEMSLRLSTAYQVSVVQIESARPRRYPRPVREPASNGGPRIVAVPLRRPQLDAVTVRRADDPPGAERTTPFARVGDTLVVRGSNLGGGGLAVRIGDLDVTPAFAAPTGDRLEVVVPDDTLPDGSTIPVADRLQPGPHPVSVVAPVPSMPSAAVSSGRGVFVLTPHVTAVSAAARTLSVTGTRLVAADLTGQVVVADTPIDKGSYLAGSDDTGVDVTVPTRFPIAQAASRLSGDLSAFPAITGAVFTLSVDIGGAGAVDATLARRPTSLAEAAALLEEALRAADPSPAYTRALVGAVAGRLVVLAGDLTSDVVFAPGALANQLRLAAASEARAVLLSGVHGGAAVALTGAGPTVDVTLGGVGRRLPLPGPLGTLTEVATSLRTALRAADPSPPFAGAGVTAVGERLCVVPGDAVAIAFSQATGVDETTAAELELVADYPVRVRVGGVEGPDPRTVRLPA